MNKLLVIICLVISVSCFAQPDSVRFYTIEEVASANPDTIYALSFRKQKLTVLPEKLFTFKNLKYLDLEKNMLSNVSRLGELNQLVYLNLGKNNLENFPVCVCQMPLLEELIVNRNFFSYVPPCIEYCKELRRIDFWETPVTTLPKEMQLLPKLTFMDFSGVRMNPNTQKLLKEQYPHVKMSLDAPCDCLD